MSYNDNEKRLPPAFMAVGTLVANSEHNRLMTLAIFLDLKKETRFHTHNLLTKSNRKNEKGGMKNLGTNTVHFLY